MLSLGIRDTNIHHLTLVNRNDTTVGELSTKCRKYLDRRLEC